MTIKVVVSILSPVCVASAALRHRPLDDRDEGPRVGLASRSYQLNV
jgi:hypothetical protein